MKKLATVTISLCTALTLLLCGGATALADDAAQPVYPEDKFVRHVGDEFRNISDFAVDGEKYAFADGKTIAVIEGGKHTPRETDSTVTALDCEGGVFYYRDGSGNAFTLSDKKAAEHAFTDKTTIVLNDESLYRLLPDGLYYYEKDNATPERVGQAEQSFYKLKEYGDRVFALCDKLLYRIEGTTATLIDLTFTDYSAASSIPVGNTAERIKSFNIDELHFVTINGGAYMTEVDLDKLSGASFAVGNTVKSGEADAPAAGKQALLLCTVGENDSVAIITVSGKCYIMSAANTTAEQRSALTAPDDGHSSATVSVAQGYAYSSPFVCDGTKIFELKSGDSVQILGVVLKTASGELARDFYKIQYVGDDGVSRTGYVPFGYVSNFSEFKEKEPSKTEDPEFTEDNAVKTVVLVIIVVALVLVAVGYLTYVATADRKKKKPVQAENTENKVK